MRHAILLCSLLALAACSMGIRLAPAPNLYFDGRNYPADEVPADLRTTSPGIFFVTDRARDGNSYGAMRSQSMAFGVADVQFGRDLSWEALVERTRADTGAPLASLTVPRVDEMVRFPATPLPYHRLDGALQHLPEATASYSERTRAFQEGISDSIAATGNRRVLVYIHGFNNDFEDSLTALANLWHFTGRQTIPVAFTWPAGNGSGVLGYFRDRDSGTFAVHHTKEFLRMLAEIPEVDQIDIVAHSRGSEVVTTALRELIIHARGGGRHPKLALKTGTLIMAAPDLDISIVRQRLQAERFSEAFEQINLYINPGDAALRLSAFLTQSRRLGALDDDDFVDGELELLRKQALVHFIRVERGRRQLGHSYFRDNPAVLSDIVLALRTRAFPGGTLRPLEQDASGVWLLHPDYPLERLPDLTEYFMGEGR